MKKSVSKDSTIKTTDHYEMVVDFIQDNQVGFYRMAFSYTKNQEAALDVVQNSICKALEKYQTLKEIGFLKTWFYRILINESLDYLRKNKREVITVAENLDVLSHVDEYGFENEDIYSALEHLPDNTKTIILLHFFEELTFAEIAEVTKVNVSTIKSRLYKGLRDLRLIMEEV